ncbi:response regulator [Rhodoferax sp.]|uniref:response regulator n=1 Tax=Rhodoferax sp. TaxID=50421 RepID=UPI0025FBDB11|nr:response regulator [Rhodoferax sp.]MCM2341006.1 response regulator [Rhodoferax sp.]
MGLISTPTSERTLLVIASDKANMQIMTQLIARRDDLNLITAVSGMEGMKLADTSLPEVVVLDTGLSDICAREVLKGLRGNPVTSHIPVIAVSSDAHPAQIQAGLQAGFYRYLTKPYKLTDLLDAIDCSLSYCLGNLTRVLTGPACFVSVCQQLPARDESD